MEDGPGRRPLDSPDLGLEFRCVSGAVCVASIKGRGTEKRCPYLFSVLSKRCHFDRALAKGEGERRNLVVQIRRTARFLDFSSLARNDTLNTYRCPYYRRATWRHRVAAPARGAPPGTAALGL